MQGLLLVSLGRSCTLCPFRITDVGQTDRDVEREELHFRPRRFLGGGHVQTLAAFFHRRKFALGTAERRLIEVEPGVPVLCECYWHRERSAATTIIVVHGLEGSSESKYMLGIAEKGVAAGMNVVLVALDLRAVALACEVELHRLTVFRLPLGVVALRFA